MPEENRKDLLKILAEEMAALGKHSTDILEMSQKLSITLLGYSQPLPPTPASLEAPANPGFFKETLGIIKTNNEVLDVVLNNLSSILNAL